ncbi:MAG: hypothetical protein IKF53_04315 [Clostridia bacterium]|nr:hypothetical protein [Clostridia bacterium]
MNEILSAAITALCALGGTALTVILGNKKSHSNILKNTDVILYRLEKIEKKLDMIPSYVFQRSQKRYTPMRRQYAAVE